MSFLKEKLQRLEDRLVYKEKVSVNEYSRKPLRWIFLEILVIPSIALGTKLGGASPEITTYLIGGAFFIIATHMSAVLQAQGAKRWHKMAALFLLFIALIIAVYLSVL